MGEIAELLILLWCEIRLLELMQHWDLIPWVNIYEGLFFYIMKPNATTMIVYLINSWRTVLIKPDQHKSL